MLPLANTRLARALYAKRSAEGFRLLQASEEIGVSLTTLFRLETQARPPSPRVLFKAARWLKVNPDDLVA
jgi:transcriptional regulator with XRE-family HTH domain